MVVLTPPSFKMTLGTVNFDHDENTKRVMTIEVKQVTEAPSSFKVELDDRDDRFTKDGEIKEGGSAIIHLGYYSKGYEKVFEGTITSVNVKRSDGARKVFTIEGKDFIQNLKRGKNRKTWLNIKDSDVISDVASQAGLGTDMDSTSTVHPYVMQNNVSNFNFIMERAKRNGWTCWCEGKTLVFKKPNITPNVGKLTWDASNVSRGSGETVLKKIDFKTSTDKVPKSVTVRHYDPDKKIKIEGKSSDVLGGSMGGQEGDALEITGGEGEEVVITDQPVRSVEEAEQLAFQRFNEMAGKFLEGDGECEGMGAIRAGYLITIDAVGKAMDGDYYVIESTHTYKVGGGEGDGYMTKFRVRRSGR